jgi:hypothetical protein
VALDYCSTIPYLETGQSKDIEQALLGAILINPSVLTEIDLDGTEFYILNHRIIYQTLLELHREGTAVDFVTVVDRLSTKGELQEIGGPAALTALINFVPSAMHAPDYARKIREKAESRKIVGIAQKLAKSAINPDGSLDRIIQELRVLQQGQIEPVEPWQAFTLADAYQERPPVEYLVSGMIAVSSLNIPYGSPGTLKSFLLGDMAICVAAGINWLPPAPWIENNRATGIATRQSPVMWLDFDNGRRRTHDRFGALGRSRDLSPDIPLHYFSMPYPWLDSSEQRSMSSLAVRIQNLGARLVIVDNLGVVAGDAEENSGDMGRVMSLWRQLAEDSQAAVVLIHHQRKSNGTTGRAGDNLRGHSSIEAALDLALLVEREEYADTINIRATKVRGPDVLPFSAAFTYEHDERGELSRARFFGIISEDNQSGAAIEREIIVTLLNTSKNKTELTNMVKETLPNVGVNRIRDMVDRLAKKGQLRISTGKNNTEKVYTRK